MNKLIIFILILVSCKILAAEDKTITVVVDNSSAENKYNVDPISASLVHGLNTVNDSVEKAGTLDCNCKALDGAYISFVYGNGTGSVGGDMAWKAFDIRVGKSITDSDRIDLVHINEGHLYNHHRDGFAIQVLHDIDLSSNAKLEVGVGPYFSMDTTTIDNKEYDAKNLGLVTTIAALYSLDKLSPGLELRADYNHVVMPGSVTTDALMIGIGKKFGAEKESFTDSDKKTEVALIGEHFKTNHGVTSASDGVAVEVKREMGPNEDLSLAYLKEGKDVLVDRQGVVAQYWYRQKLPANWDASVGAGPYIAQNKLDPNTGTLNGVISIEVKKELRDQTNFFIRFNRIADFKGSNDRDMLSIGVSKKF